MENQPTAHSIEEAALRIAPWVKQTPVLSSQAINAVAGAEIVFKCENFQRVGAFKFRGAVNAAYTLDKADLAKGLATHSSGNHAQALALAAKMLETKAYIVMPENSPQVKIDAVKGYGAEVTFCVPTLEARESTLKEVTDRTGATFIPPYDHYRIIEGQATTARELVRAHPSLDVVMCPVGGGGLLAGTALAVHYFSPNTKVIAGEPTGADDAWRSFQAGKIIPSQNPKTLADGLLTSLGTRNFPIIQKHVEDIITVDDEAIIRAMRLIWERMKLVVEPSAAVPLAAVLENKSRFAGQRLGIILSGGNVDLGKLPF